MWCCSGCGVCECCGGYGGGCTCTGDWSTGCTSCSPIAGSCAENLCTDSLCCLDCVIAACCAPIDANDQANSGQTEDVPCEFVDALGFNPCDPNHSGGDWIPNNTNGAGTAPSRGSSGSSPMSGSGGGGGSKGGGPQKPTVPPQSQNPNQLTAAIAKFGTSIANAIGNTISRSQALLGNNAKAKQVTTTAGNGDLMILVILIIIIVGGLFLKSSEGE